LNYKGQNISYTREQFSQVMVMVMVVLMIVMMMVMMMEMMMVKMMVMMVMMIWLLVVDLAEAEHQMEQAEPLVKEVVVLMKVEEEQQEK